MADSVPVRCPGCRREHTYAPPAYLCACGAPVTLPLLRGALPVRVRHRTWAGSWVEVRCPACGRTEEWPQPEVGCGCGTMLRLPVAPPAMPPGAPGAGGGATQLPSPGPLSAGPALSASLKPYGSYGPLMPPTPHEPAALRPARPAFSPVTIRTAQDARTAAAHYLRWLGFTDVRVTERAPASGVDLRGPGVVAHVDPTTAPTTLRDVETLWLNGLNEAAVTACFSLAGYAREARTRADALSVALFVLDLTGMPQAVNDPADDLIRANS
ncbi:MAG: hypothetical protein ACRDP3_28055 [Streptomyces sp.]|uniref:hypothetical protein n=1 Tax=Streptomyces sp. TaxID=1931 RepID=UPI003D6AA9EC